MFFGIISLLMVGASWCLTGAIMGQTPKRGVDAISVQLLGGLLSLLVSIVILCFMELSSVSLKVLLAAGGCYMANGILNCVMLQLMSYSMQYGPNGVIWSIIQSALIFSFLGGIVFFGVDFTVWRGIGIVLLTLTLFLFALSKDNTEGGGGRCHHWKLAAFVALAINSVQQNLSTAPSYYPEAREISSVLRTLMITSGGVLMSFLWQLFSNRASQISFKLQLKNRYLWYYAVALNFVSLIFSYLLLYPGMDALAKLGAGAISYPLMVGSCIVTFTIYSRWTLKERMNPMQCLALLVCIVGLVTICL